ncbi:hypothetical protein ACIBH1_48105 [Nonomuraea sp. NPDC050663]
MNRLAEQVMGPVLAPRDEGYDEGSVGWQTASIVPTWWWAPPDPPTCRRR